MNAKQSKRLRRYVKLTFPTSTPAELSKQYDHAKQLYLSTRSDQRHVFMKLMQTMAEGGPASITQLADAFKSTAEAAQATAESLDTLAGAAETFIDGRTFPQKSS